MDHLDIVGEGATTKIYRDGDRAIKLYVDAPPDEAEREAAKQQFARAAGLPVPPVYSVRPLDERTTALEMAYVDGRAIMRPDMSAEELGSALAVLVKLQVQVHGISGRGLPRQTERLAGKIQHTAYLEQACKQALLAHLSALDSGADRLCHGDFHPFNVLFDGRDYWIIDWVDATAGHLEADACRTWLLLSLFDDKLGDLYLEDYSRESGIGEAAIRQWLPVIAAARLDENVSEEERGELLALIRESLN